MFNNLKNLILSKEKEIQGISYLLASQDVDSWPKEAGSLTELIKNRKFPLIKPEGGPDDTFRNAFVSYLSSMLIPRAQEYIKEDLKKLEEYDNPKNARTLYRLLDRFESFLKGLAGMARAEKVGNPERGENFIKELSSLAVPSSEDGSLEMLENLDQVIFSFEQDKKNGIPPVVKKENEEDKPAGRYQLLNNFLSSYQNKYS